MDPDEALQVCLTSPDPAVRDEAAHGLWHWLRHGGYPPAERIVREAGIDRRMKLMKKYDWLYLEKYREGWCVVCASNLGEPAVYHRLRRA